MPFGPAVSAYSFPSSISPPLLYMQPNCGGPAASGDATVYPVYTGPGPSQPTTQNSYGRSPATLGGFCSPYSSQLDIVYTLTDSNDNDLAYNKNVQSIQACITAPSAAVCPAPPPALPAGMLLIQVTRGPEGEAKSSYAYGISPQEWHTLILHLR